MGEHAMKFKQKCTSWERRNLWANKTFGDFGPTGFPPTVHYFAMTSGKPTWPHVDLRSPEAYVACKASGAAVFDQRWCTQS